MKNTTKGLLSTILFFYTLFSIAQNPYLSISDSIEQKFRTQLSAFPQEKLYVQIDKPYYITGEDIWFRVHLVDALLNVPDTTSRYVYAELINPLDSVISRLKIRQQDGIYKGHVSLDEELPEGEYQLRFYTKFQESIGDDYFFKRTVRVGSPLSVLYRTDAAFQYREKDDKVNIELRIADIKDNTLIRPDKISVTDNKKVNNVKPDDDNIIRISTNVAEKGNKIILLEYDYSGKFNKQYIYVPHRENYEVALLPEGGSLPLGGKGRIAFKALNAEGLGEDVTGTIVNESGEELANIESMHRGMGYFSFQSDAAVGNTFAVFKNKKGLEKRYKIPEATANTISLQALWQRDQLYVSVNKSSDISPDKKIYMIAQCRGIVLQSFLWDNTKEFVTYSKEQLPSGVIQFLLVDSEMNPISERLIFNINKVSFANVEFSTNKDNYAKREKISASINLSDIEGNAAISNFSVSVTDDNDVKPDSCVSILSALLLTSELKGYIESPAYYFTDADNVTQSHLDVLMMTQGWSRYNVSKILKGDYQKPTSFLEIGPEISGDVKGGLLLNKPAKDCPITLVSNERGLFETTISDEEGRFRFNNLELPDSITYMMQAQTKNGGRKIVLTIDPETFPIARYSSPFSPFGTTVSVFENYLQKADQQFVLVNGIRMIYLKDVVVTADKYKTGKSFFSSPMNMRFTIDKINKLNSFDVYALLANFPGVQVSGSKKISIRGGGNKPTLLLDNIDVPLDRLMDILVEDIEEIEIMKTPFDYLFGLSVDGTIMITRKTGDAINRRKNIFDSNIKKITPLGYQVTKEFYSPQYEDRLLKESSIPDLRTTIYWNPSVKTTEEGKAEIDFYTSDASTTYSVVIEGIASNGLLIHTMKKISRKDK